MAIIVALTGAVGFITSYILLSTGFTVMWERYLLSTIVSYFAFVIFLWIWLRSKREDYIDIPDLSGNISPDYECAASDFSGNGGEFGGGGASSSFDDYAGDFGGGDVSRSGSGSAFGENTSIGDSLEAAGQADEFAVPLLIIVVLIAVSTALAIIFFGIINSAPGLFAEIMLDALLSTGLYRRLRKIEQRNWLQTAVKRTILPFIITACLVASAGWFLQRQNPTANTLWQAIHSDSKYS